MGLGRNVNEFGWTGNEAERGMCYSSKIVSMEKCLTVLPLN